QPSSAAFVALTGATTSGNGGPTTPMSSEYPRQQEANIEALPWLTGQSDQVDLPTEREILKGMDIASSLLTRSRPQASLVPQPQGPVGALLPGDPDDGTARTNEAGTFDAKEDMDVRPYLMSPVGDAVLGPRFLPGGATPTRSLNQRLRTPSGRVLEEPSKGSDDFLPAEGPLQPKPSVPSFVPMNPKGNKARDYFLPLPLLLSVLGQFIYWPHGHTGVRKRREQLGCAGNKESGKQ